MAETIACRECGAEFEKPRFARRKHGFGFGMSNLAGYGDYKCPKCGYKGGTEEFAPSEPKKS
jgi:DNA-directed RNA polymerase subunit RPC12/RpoP